MVNANTHKTVVMRLDVNSLVSFRLDSEMKKRVDKEAGELGLTRSELLRIAIEYYFDMMNEPDFDEVTTLAHAHNRGANE